MAQLKLREAQDKTIRGISSQISLTNFKIKNILELGEAGKMEKKFVKDIVKGFIQQGEQLRLAFNKFQTENNGTKVKKRFD